MIPTAFLDRDGTINVRAPEGEYVRNWSEFRYLPGAAEAVRKLKQAGWRVIVVTNQRGIARGLLRQGDVDEIHERMTRDLSLDGVYVCPHEDGTCSCRKPEIGLFQQAIADHSDIRIEAAVMIGDSASDAEAGRRFGCYAVRVGVPSTPSLSAVVDHVLRKWWLDAVACGVGGVPDETLVRAVELIVEADVVLTVGNGGSAALAYHAAQAINKPDYAAGGGRAAVCLTDNVSMYTAHANDGGWEGALAECARPFLENKNIACVLILISSSGRSKNIIQLAQLATKYRCPIVAFTGFGGDPLRLLAEVSVHVDSYDYEVVEPVHDALLHRMQYHLRERYRRA